MKSGRINYEDLKIAKEICPFIKVRLKRIERIFINKNIANKGKILAVDTCPIGDFLSHLPALRTYTNLC
jgi:hypothetical protein